MEIYGKGVLENVIKSKIWHGEITLDKSEELCYVLIIHLPIIQKPETPETDTNIRQEY